ncbi:serine/threonine protein kinase [Coemansia sp. RSA 353]|nr:serine/threonine protein kinase [Coemansia sp. RSA 355]KAJ2296849.1 serine/threonine protein kinase [Coemansia sp. RSA 353]KAJ2405658.1 serine/threonine protein kinase [Coemansia sp. RSA 2526]
MGVISDLEKKVESSHFHLHHDHNRQHHQQPSNEQQSSTEQHKVEMPVESHKASESATPAETGPGSNAPGPLRHIRHSSLKIRTDSANHDVSSLPPQPKTAGVNKSHLPFGEAHQNHGLHLLHHAQHAPTPQAAAAGAAGGGVPKPAAASASPIMIKRNTSFSQRLHNLLHRDKPHKHSPAAAAAALPAVGDAGVQSRHNGTSGYDTPTIAYRTPTVQTQSTDVSANASATVSTANTPPSGISPHASSANIAKEAAAVPNVSSAYRAQRGFEPVPEDKVFAVSNINLRAVQRHGHQIRRSIDEHVPEVGGQESSSAVDELAHSVQHAYVSSSREASAHSVSREPSQNTLHQNQSAADIHGAGGDHVTDAPAAGRISDTTKVKIAHPEVEESPLAVTTLPSKPTAADVARNREQLAAGTTRDQQPVSPTDTHSAPCQKKAGPVYSTHKAKLNQFGRQTKVIGKGTGGTVHLLRGVELDARPPSLRSGPPSSHHGDEPNTYSPSEHKLFAVKEFRKRRQDETPRAYMKKVTSEFCIGSSIHQENVIETLDLIFEGDRVYEIMEYCPHDLFTCVSRGNMDLDETFCWFKQVCQGVQYLHKIGIAHRDLKLENCLLTENGIVKIIDFGCATVYKTPFQKEPSKVVGVCGSDPYIAPEVLMSRRQIPYFAQVADIWSVGIMYMCMTLLKFPWRIADTEVDRCYGSYIREWPRGRDKLIAQLPQLRDDGNEVIKGMVYPDIKGRLTMDQVMESKWIKNIDVCHANHLARTHAHHLKID